eukprot:jgi/Bigna1/83717/fgenesh1_pg.114_\
MTTRSFIRALAVLSLLALFSLPISFGLLEKVWGVAEEGAAGGTLIVDLSPSVVAHGQALADDDDNSGDAADEGDTDDFGVLKISNGEGASRFLFYDGELSSQRPFRVPSLDPFFGGGELGDDPKGKEGGEGAGGLEGFGMTMKFRTMRRWTSSCVFHTKTPPLLRALISWNACNSRHARPIPPTPHSQAHFPLVERGRA